MGERGNKENAAMLEMVKTYPTFDVSLSWKGQNTRRENSVLSNPKHAKIDRENRSKSEKSLSKRHLTFYGLIFCNEK